MDTCGKLIYANEKVKDALNYHEDDIRCKLPKTRAKVVILGNSGVGKTSIIYRSSRTENEVPHSTTIGASFLYFDIRTSTEDILFQAWDTAGQERFMCMVPMYMRNAVAAILVYDVTDRTSFEQIDTWLDELDKVSSVVDPQLILLANKTDLPNHKVCIGEGQRKADEIGARFYEVSKERPFDFEKILIDVAMDINTTTITNEQQKKADSIVNLGKDSNDNDIIHLGGGGRRKKCCSLI